MTFQMTKELATEFDFIIALDASGSMATTDAGERKSRWQQGQETIEALATELGQFDDDGLTVVLFGGGVNVFDGVTADKVHEVFASRGPRGGTPLHSALSEIVKKHNASGKKCVAIVLTDGVPDNEDAAAKVIVDAANALDKDEDLTFLFVQVGHDSAATSYLKMLDDGLTGAKFDIVDTVTIEEAGSLDAIDLLTKAIND